ncbi:MAG: SAVED domain-containing protein [Acutalibacteraceae bacterium]|nr:SAVED domain-containing protein [Acutalibacteraceae bacterium]
MSRGKNPSDNTIRMLCGKAAGMCEFEGCGKRLFYDNVTLSEFNNAFVAHIIASSKKGPRGDAELSHKLSDKIENLMLMCADHHKLIDIPSTGPRDYPVERLKEMKRNHEERVERICSLFNVPKTEIVMFSSPIKGKVSVNIDYKLAAKAVLPNKQPDSPYGINIPVFSRQDYRSEEYWKDCLSALEVQFNANLYNPFIQFNKSNFSIFPIAPIPLIIKLGELIGDKLPCDVYQKTRMPDTWEWQSDEQTNNFDLHIDKLDFSNNSVALVLSLTDDISAERVLQTGKYDAIYKIKADTLGVDCIKSTVDLSLFWHKFQETCDAILNSYGGSCIINLFPAIPVSAAFEVGRRYMPNTYPVITIFDEDNGFFETLKLGG